jgi:hypothetical protein
MWRRGKESEVGRRPKRSRSEWRSPVGVGAGGAQGRGSFVVGVLYRRDPPLSRLARSSVEELTTVPRSAEEGGGCRCPRSAPPARARRCPPPTREGSTGGVGRRPPSGRPFSWLPPLLPQRPEEAKMESRR